MRFLALFALILFLATSCHQGTVTVKLLSGGRVTLSKKLLDNEQPGDTILLERYGDRFELSADELPMKDTSFREQAIWVNVSSGDTLERTVWEKSYKVAVIEEFN